MTPAQTKKAVGHDGLSVSKKSACGVLFRDLRRFPLAPMGLPGGKRRKETLHSKVSESAAHVAGFGLHLEGFGPPNLLEGFFDSLRPSGMTAFSVSKKSACGVLFRSFRRFPRPLSLARRKQHPFTGYALPGIPPPASCAGAAAPSALPPWPASCRPAPQTRSSARRWARRTPARSPSQAHSWPPSFPLRARRTAVPLPLCGEDR